MPDTYYVREGAKLSCSLGNTSSMLKVPIGHGFCIQGKNEATIMDNKAGINIMPFGTCAKSSPPVPCTPTIVMPWQMGKKDFIIKGQMALLNTCVVPCMCGGIIKIEDDGQKK